MSQSNSQTSKSARCKTMLNGYVAETNGRVKDRMRIIIRIKCDDTRICKAVGSFGKSNSESTSGTQDTVR